MATEILAMGSTAANSTPVTVAAGTPTTIHARGNGTPYSGRIQIENSDASWTTIATLSNQEPAQTIYGPGEYRIARDAGQTFAVDQD